MGKSKRTKTCPGCKLDANEHSFGACSKYCEGPQPEDENASAHLVEDKEGLLAELKWNTKKRRFVKQLK